MPDPYGTPWRDDPYRYRHEDRGFMDRAGDEVRTWLGDEEAERRRRMDERERQRYYARESAPYHGDRWRQSGVWPDDDGRIEYDRRPRPGFSGYGWRDRGVSAGYGGETGRDTSWSGPSSSAYGYTWPYWPYYGGVGPGDRWRERYFTGRGPKGYQRPDNRINEDVCDRLGDAPDVDATDIEVTVKNGEVTLSGTVEGRWEKRRAEDLAENISGVREVHNNLRIGRAQESSVGSTGSPAGATTRR